VSLVCVDEHQMLKDIEKLIKQTLPRDVIPGFEPDLNAKPQPIQLRSGAPGHGNRGGRPGGGRNNNAAPRSAGGAKPANGAARGAGAGGAKPANGAGRGGRSGAPQRAGGRER
jgi:ATP-dependent RNA helicase RhlE